MVTSFQDLTGEENSKEIISVIKRIANIDEGFEYVRSFLRESREEVLMSSLNAIFALRLKKEIEYATNRKVKVKLLIAKEYMDKLGALRETGAEIRLIEENLVHPMRCDVSDSKKANFAVIEPSLCALHTDHPTMVKFFIDLFNSWWERAEPL